MAPTLLEAFHSPNLLTSHPVPRVFSPYLPYTQHSLTHNNFIDCGMVPASGISIPTSFLGSSFYEEHIILSSKSQASIPESLSETYSPAFSKGEPLSPENINLDQSMQDLSLVEKVEVAEDCSIYFCASSIDTPGVLTVPGRIRAHIKLHAWVLEPIFLSNSSLPPNSNSASTKVTYHLQVDIKTFVAKAISQRFLARRPLCITKIDYYIQKHGSPIQIDGLNQAESQPGQGGTRNGLQRNYMSIQKLEFSPQTNHARFPSSTNNTPATRSKNPYRSNMNLLCHKFQHHLASSSSSPLLNPDKTSPRSLPIGYASSSENPPKLPLHIGWIKQLMSNEESFGWNKSNYLAELFLKYSEDSTANQKNWKEIQNATNSSHMLLNVDLLKYKQAQPEKLFSLLLIKIQATLVTQIEYQSSPVTLEQVLVTIFSSLAQQIRDAKLHGYSK
ncbi:hypothetical protein O181_051072 [Austropuccinia psidii MF-1]|uniref:Uncharacterized protein n=1 Tax=Austropuccinia psidii MF-1 TaxID=1389203 RepID=A0A9Q3E078_9BASI|nr:hypothetical protein [Austropuccinia psidii MF-1]